MRRSTLLFACSFGLLIGALPGAPLDAQIVPTPESVLGYPVGADFHLATYEESIRYFQALAAASDRIRLIEVGRTSEDRPFYLAVISSAENLAQLDHYREISRRLAHPEGLTDTRARELAREGRAIVHIDGAVHASEVAASQHTIRLAWELLSVTGDPRVERIMANVIFMLWPTANPDGQTIVAEWYRSNLGTPYETAALPWLYQKYVGHDNNRDAYMLDMIESRVIERTWREWEPQIRYIHHQTSPFPTRIWLPPFKDPIGARVHPLMTRTANTIGMHMAQALEERGQVGATHYSSFDAWYPGYIDYLPMLQNSIAFWTETALYSYATPRYYTLSEFPADRRDLRPESLYASPWPGGWWRIGDAVAYMVTASTAVLDYAATYREQLLYNRYQAGRDAIRRYAAEPPYAYFFPPDQRDPVAAVELLRRLAFNGVEIRRLTRPVTLHGIACPAGTWVVPMDQPYAPLARTLLEVQHYPDIREGPGGEPARPYDVSGWTLPYLFDLRVVEAREPLSEELRAALAPVSGPVADWRAADRAAGTYPDPAPFDSVPGVGFDTDPVAAGILPPEGRITGSGDALAVDPAQNNAFRAVNRTWREGGKVSYERGRYLLTGLKETTLREMVASLHLQAERTRPGGTPLARPRIGLFRPWPASMDEGWTRWLLEQYGFDFFSLRPDDILAPGLCERCDVILLADYSARTIQQGFQEGTVPARYAGGIGEAGERALDGFVRAGGTLVCWNAGCRFAIDALGLPVRDVTARLPRSEFSISGSILAASFAADHPVMAGMRAEGAIFFGGSPVFETTEGFEGWVLARYQESGSPLLSGFLLGEEHLHGRAAAVDVRHGVGHVVLIGFQPQWRGQPFGTFRVLFNAALFHASVAAAAPSGH
jgi:hypothetical protein